MNEEIIKCIVCGEDTDYDISVGVKDFGGGGACKPCASGLKAATIVLRKTLGIKTYELKSQPLGRKTNV